MRDKSVVQLYSAFTPLLWGLRQKWMIPSCFLRKVVKFFGKEHVNWSSISGVMIGRSWTIKFGKICNLFGYTNFEFSELDFSNSSCRNSINTGPIDMISTTKCNYFSLATRWNHSFLSPSQ